MNMTLLEKVLSLCSTNSIAYIACMLVGLVLLVNIFHVYAFSFRSRQKVAGPKAFPIVSNLLSILLKPCQVVDIENIKNFGHIYGVFEGTALALVVADLSLLKQIMIKDFHVFTDRRPRTAHKVFKHFLTNLTQDEWRRSRSTLTPTFTSGKIKAMFSLMQDSCKKLEVALKCKASLGEEVELKSLYGCYTLDVIAKCCFTTETNAFNDPNDAFLRNARDFRTGHGGKCNSFSCRWL